MTGTASLGSQMAAKVSGMAFGEFGDLPFRGKEFYGYPLLLSFVLWDLILQNSRTCQLIWVPH